MTTRQELQRAVVATNKVLEEAVKEMSDIVLLRNVHPLYRPDFTYRLLREELITKEEAHEFVKLAVVR